MRTLATMKADYIDLREKMYDRKEPPKQWFQAIARFLALRDEIRRTENLILGDRRNA